MSDPDSSRTTTAILFVCTGNTCRSPMAEAIAQRWLRDHGDELPDTPSMIVASAGVAAGDGMPTNPEAVDALDRLGIEFSGRSKQLTAEMVREATLVLCMTEGHAAAARSIVEHAGGDVAHIHRLDPERDIDDPIGLGAEAYDSVAARLVELIPGRLRALLTAKGAPSA